MTLTRRSAGLAASYRPALPGGRVVVLFTQEIRGHPVPCGCYEGQPGGLARVPAAAGGDLGSRSAILVDAGDFLGAPRVAGFDDPDRPGSLLPAKRAYLRGRSLAQARMMGRLGYDAVCPGEGDFLLGQAFLLSALRDPPGSPSIWAPRREPPFVCANVLLPGGEALFPAFRILRVGRGSLAGLVRWGGVRVGVMGLVSPALPIPRDPEDLYALSVGDATAAARTALEKMREGGAEVILVLYHGPDREAAALMRAVPGIDLVVAGHEGSWRWSREPGSGWAAQTNPGGTEVGRAVLAWENGRVGDASFQRLVLAPELPEDPRVIAPWREFQAALAASPPAPPRLADPAEPYAGHARCRDCHGRESAQWAATPHARALETLREKGHSGDPECLQCHTTGFAERTGFGAPGAAPGLDAVGCESCHGPHGNHAAAWERRKAAGETPPEARLRPDSRPPMCVRCHDGARDPNFKSNAQKRYDKVRHR
jgi:hypothetical protein